MPAVRGMGFINAVIIQLLNYRPFKEQLALLSNGH